MLKFIKATSNSKSLLISSFLPWSSIILLVYFLKRLKISKSLFKLVIPPSWLEFYWANLDSFSIREMKIVLISVSAFRELVVSRSCSRVYKWNSSGNAWITHSIKYCWAILSLHMTTISRILGNTTWLYISKVTPLRLLKRMMFSPTVTLSSFLSTSL